MQVIAHRGIGKENCKKSIEKAIKINLPVEFDVFFYNGKIVLGHPPQKPRERLIEVLPLFKGAKVYPKIDIKVKKNVKQTLRKVAKLIKIANIEFALVNIDHCYGKKAIESEKFFIKLIKEYNINAKLNVDLYRYKNLKFKAIIKHLRKVSNYIYSISAELHESDLNKIASLASFLGIENLQLWVRGFPDATPRINKKDAEKIKEVEKNYKLKVWLDVKYELIKKARKFIALQVSRNS